MAVFKEREEKPPKGPREIHEAHREARGIEIAEEE